jgi:glutamine cyclotransferase
MKWEITTDDELVLVSTKKENILTEGWGLAYREPSAYRDGFLFASEGTSTIYLIDPVTWTLDSTLSIIDEDESPLTYLNELEIIN